MIEFSVTLFKEIRAMFDQLFAFRRTVPARSTLEKLKAKALALREVQEDKPARRWREDTGYMTFLHAL